MSHLTRLSTSFQNLEYLEKSLNKLDVLNYRKEYGTVQNESMTQQNKLIISQLNNFEFNWNGKEYELIGDFDLWSKPYSADSFIQSIIPVYSEEAIVGEGRKLGFQPVEIKHNSDRSYTIRMERWNSNAVVKSKINYN